MEQKPFYLPMNYEVDVFRSSYERKLPLLLKGPTGCGKSRFVEAMAFDSKQKLISVSCNEDTSASDLLGRFLIQGGDTIWQDGPVTRAVREGYFLYLDEIAEAREDVMVVLHSLTDHRREIYIDRTNEVLHASSTFMLFASFNPGYQSRLREMKPSTRQRFVSLSFQYPKESIEVDIIHHESELSKDQCLKLVRLANVIRSLKEFSLKETVSTRLIVHAAHLIKVGLPTRLACEVGIIEALTDEIEIIQALGDIVALKI